MSERHNNAAALLKSILLLGIILLLLLIMAAYPAYIEKYYSEFIFPYFSSILRLIFNYIPFSLGDIGYLLLIIWIFYGLINLGKALIKKRYKAAGLLSLKGVVVFEVLLLWFYISWGLNYSRQPAVKLLSLQDTSYTLSDVKALSARLVDSVNYCRGQLKPNDFKASNAVVISVAEHAVNHLKTVNLRLAGQRTHVKRSLFTPLLNYMGTAGYNNPFTGEAQLNVQMPVFDRPITACHEMAHQLGFAREDEANFIGYMAGIHSSNQLLKYSAYYLATGELLVYLQRRDSSAARQLVKQLSAPVKADLKTDSLYWANYEGEVNRVTSIFYNQFLKVNKQPAGLRTYNRMIILLMAWYRQKQLTAFVKTSPQDNWCFAPFLNKLLHTTYYDVNKML